MVFARGGDERRQTEEALTFILETMKRPCRIALRTDLFWLYREQKESNSDIRLAAAMARHRIAWTMVPPTSDLIGGGRCALCADQDLLGGV